MKTKPVTAARHAEEGGAVCPVCRHDDPQGESISSGGGEASQEMYCQECGSEWVDVYTLVRYNLTRRGDA